MDHALAPTTSIPTSLQMLLRDLAFLGQITRGKKPCMKSRILVDGNSWTGAAYRAYKGENRIIYIGEVERIFGQCIEAIREHEKSEHIKIIVEFASGAYTGVESSRSTYNDDPDMLSRIDVALKNLDLQLSKFRRYIKGYSTENKTDNKDKTESSSISVSSIPPFTEEDAHDSNGIDLFGTPSSDERRKLKDKLKKKAENR